MGEAALAAGADSRTGMPARVLGRTGARVSILAYGCGSSFTEYGTFEQAFNTLNRALDLGISYIDTAVSYGSGKSEEIVGEAMKSRRSDVWLSTKIRKRGHDEIMRLLDRSLKRLQTDQVDLLHIHDLQGAADLAAIESPNGALKAFYKIRDQKIARFIGITSHKDPAMLKAALERHDFDCTQMALNPAIKGTKEERSFEALALPVAVRKKLGVIAMKVFGQERFRAPAAHLMRYALSLPVSSAAVGMPTLKVMEEDVRIAKAFQPMPESEMEGLADSLSAAHKARLDRFFGHHVDA
jgi:aryl-alcohol dehydrogenase-like predicted oxidoreductase